MAVVAVLFVPGTLTFPLLFLYSLFFSNVFFSLVTGFECFSFSVYRL